MRHESKVPSCDRYLTNRYLGQFVDYSTIIQHIFLTNIDNKISLKCCTKKTTVLEFYVLVKKLHIHIIKVQIKLKMTVNGNSYRLPVL